MNVLVTAGPTREYIDGVRFISNASSGKMGYAVAAAAIAAGHDVTLLTGPVHLDPPGGVAVVAFVSVADLASALAERFDACDAVVMAAAVGDFTVAAHAGTKLRRTAGPVTIELVPTEDLLAGLARRRRGGQVLIGFAVEQGDPLAGAGAKLTAKGVDYVVVNTPAAFAADAGEAAIVSRGGVVLPWAERSKRQLAREIVALLGR